MDTADTVAAILKYIDMQNSWHADENDAECQIAAYDVRLHTTYI